MNVVRFWLSDAPKTDLIGVPASRNFHKGLKDQEIYVLGCALLLIHPFTENGPPGKLVFMIKKSLRKIHVWMHAFQCACAHRRMEASQMHGVPMTLSYIATIQQQIPTTSLAHSFTNNSNTQLTTSTHNTIMQLIPKHNYARN